MSETSSPVVLPPQSTGRTWSERSRFMQQFSLVLLVLMGLSFLSLIPIYLELRSGPVLLDMGITLLAVSGLLVAHLVARQQRLMESGYAVLFVALLMVAGVFVEQGNLLLSAPPILIGVLLTIITIWPNQWGRWLLVILFYSLLLLATQQVTLSFSYNLAQAESFNIRNGVVVVGGLSVALLAFARSLQRGSIRARLIISYISLALLPVILVGLAISLVNVQRAQTQIFGQLDAIASQKETELLTWVDQLQRTLAISLTARDTDIVEQLLQTPTGENAEASVAQIEQSLQNVIVQTELFEEIFILDLQGRIVISTDAAQVDKIQINQLYFREGVNAPYFQPPLFTPSLGTVSMVVSQPLYDSQQNKIGVIAGRVNLEQLTQIASRLTGMGERSELYFIGLNNGLITRPRLAESDGTLFIRSEGAVAAISRRERGQGLYENYRGVQVVGVYKWLPDLQMALLAEQEVDEAFATIRTGVLTSVIAVVVAAFLALMVALYMARTIATPVVQLADAAKVVAGGNLAERVELERDDEIGLLASAFNSMTGQLQMLIGGLEERVAEQTRDLTLAAEVGQRIATERNLDSLLTAAAQLIKDRFDLYHAQIYLTNPTEQLLILRASTGEAGRELLRRGHRLTVGPGSINGAAAANRQPVIVSDTQQDLNFRPNPLLPQTRSELAIPLLVGERVVGVLDLQSEYPNALSETNLSAFQTLAGQLAVAIENASLFTEVENARTILEEQSRRLTRTSWDSYLDAITRQERFVASYQVDSSTTPDESAPQVAVPMQVANEPIGFIKLVGKSADELSEDQLALVQGVANQVAQQVENLRLFAQTEQYRFQAEQAVRRLTREGWEAYHASTGDAAAGYIYTQDQVLPLSTAPTDNGTNGTYIHPLTLRGEPIGAFHLPSTHTPDDSTIAIIDAIAETLIDHIENLRLSEATQTALAQTETLYTLTSQLTQSETLDNVAQIIAGLYEDSSVTLLTIESDALGQPEWLTIAASWTATPSLIDPGTRFPLAAFPISSLWIKSGGKPVLIENIETDPRVDEQTRAISQQFGIMASAYLPLRVGQSWVGLITISWQNPKMFSEGEIQLIESLSAQAAVVVNNRLLLQSTTKRANRETMINTINRRIQSATSVETALETAAREISQLLKARQTLVEINPMTQPGS
ncbi:MAG: GAF domain-containing protein [Anaerolineae bacterium]|nr:GAF domain-containing protein [Anaerolineae bacterium]